jgi:hypothetical protein
MEGLLQGLVVGAIVGITTGIMAETFRSVIVFIIGISIVFAVSMVGILTFIPLCIIGIVIVEKE